jgi:protease YdgD
MMCKISGSILLSLVWAAPAWADASALVQLSDRQDIYGWEAVGRVDIAKGGYCTGVLIANDLVLTAAHCVFDKKTGEALPPESFTFKAGLINGKAIQTAKSQRAVAHKSYDPHGKTNQENIRYDAALIQLAKPITTFSASPFKLHSGTPDGDEVSVLSYGAGRDNALSMQKRCAIIGHEGGVMAFDCDATQGSSGAPVFAREDNHTRILSLISSSGKSEKGDVSFGMELPEVVAQLKKDLPDAPAAEVKKPRSTLRLISVGGGRKTSGAKFIKN